MQRELLVYLEPGFVHHPAERGQAMDVGVVEVAEEVGLAGPTLWPARAGLEVDVDRRLAVVGDADAVDRAGKLGTTGGDQGGFQATLEEG